MRVLHLFSNSKWTGPAEPALRLCLTLRERGVTVDFACAPKRANRENMIVDTARAHGLEPLSGFHLSKHRNPLLNWLDCCALKRYLRDTAYDLVHCHLDNDHEIALCATRHDGPPVVRSLYTGDGMPATRRHRRLALGSEALIEPSEMAAQADQALFGLSPDRCFVIANAVDVERFNPRRTLPDSRKKLGIPSNAFVLGIVARMQPHRHYDDLFDAFARFVRVAPESRLVVIGRGSRQEQVAFAPIRRLKLDSHVLFTGYITNDEYVATLAALDIGVFLQPGTDGACRAVRELMAMGKPTIVADRGMLREIVTHGHNGIVTDGSPEALCRAMEMLYNDVESRRQYAANAQDAAHARYALPAQADAVIGVYEHVLRTQQADAAR